MTTTALDAYRARLRRVLEHIEQDLEADLSVERLSAVAAFSKFHFHRQFSELFGLSVGRYVQLLRLKRASYQLVFRPELRVIEVALASGYDSHEAFSRAFKKAFGQTPSEFREQPAWHPWLETYQPMSELRSSHMTNDHDPEDVRIIDFAPLRVAVLEHRGDPRRLFETIRSFVEWRKQNGLRKDRSRTFNILYDDPFETQAARFRFDLCAAIEGEVPDNTLGVYERTIPGGRCATLRHVGSDDTLGESVRYLYGTWLPASGEEVRDFPLYLERVRFFPDVPENEAVLDLYLPLR
ncbi:MAG: AraC family transcriptional regulator [Polyangiaceae bacterium]